MEVKHLLSSKVFGVFVPAYTETEHWYEHTETKKKLPSVTTITGILDKPWLAKWKIKEGIKYLVNNQGEYLHISQLDRAIDAAVKASEIKTEKAQHIGTAVHETIERWINDWIVYNKKPETSLVHYYDPKFEIDTVTHLRYDLTETQIIAALRSAEKYFESLDNSIYPIAYELTVGDLEFGYAGKLDLLMSVGGEIEVWDWKTSNQIPENDATYPMQINAYTAAFEKMTGITINKLRLIKLSKAEDRFTMFEVEKSKELLDAFYSLCNFYEKTKLRETSFYKKIHSNP